MENTLISESGNGARHYGTPEEQGNVLERQGNIPEEQEEMLPPELSLQEVSDIVDQGSKDDSETHGTLYGMPLFGVKPIRPPLPTFLWESDCLSSSGTPVKQFLEPAPAATAPEGYTYPQAEIYRLSDEDHRYARKYYYHYRMLRTAIPPIEPFHNGQSLCWEPIAGQFSLEIGVPLVQVVNDDPHNLQTRACLHTPKSLASFPGGSRVLPLSKELRDLMYGRPACGDLPAIRPFYRLDGLVKNDRSDGAIPDNSPDGSYNLAATIGKGKGRGELQPAAQTTTPEAVLQINRILGIVYELRQIVLKASLNNFEWSMLEFHSLDNNTFGFGGLGPSGTGCQANVSSNGRPLRELIGQYQGSLHTDEGDDPCDFTVMILILRCPPGSDPGPFILARYGVYVREIDAWIIFLVFHGNDLHTGFEPITNKLTEEQLDHLDQAYNMAGEPNRINIISYPSWAAASRVGKVALNFSEHGHHLFMNKHARANRLGREFFFAFYNSLQYGGLTLRMEIDDLLRRITYVDEDKQDIPLDPLPGQIDVVHNATTVELQRGYWACEINVLPTFPNDLSESPEHIIQQVLGHKKVDGKIMWTIQIVGDDAPHEMLQAPWFQHPVNRAILADFVKRDPKFLSTFPEIDFSQSADDCQGLSGHSPTNMDFPYQPPLPPDSADNLDLSVIDTANDPTAEPPGSGEPPSTQPCHLSHDTEPSRSLESALAITELPHSCQLNATGLASPGMDSTESTSMQSSHRLPLQANVDASNGLFIGPPGITEPAGTALGQRLLRPGIVTAGHDPLSSGGALDSNIGFNISDPIILDTAQSLLADGGRLVCNDVHEFLDDAVNAAGMQESDLNDFFDDAADIPMRDHNQPLSATLRKRGIDDIYDSDSGPETESESDEMYEYEQIIDYRMTQNGAQWLVKWVGYDSPDDDDMWLFQEDFNDTELLDEYNMAHGIPSTSPTVLLPAKNADNPSIFERMLDPLRLIAELNLLRLEERTNASNSKFRKVTSSRDLVQRVIEQDRLNTQYERYMSFAPVDDSGHLVWTGINAQMTVKCLAGALTLLPALHIETCKMQIMTRAFQWEMCRSLLTVYDWLSSSGPELARSLFATHSRNGMSGVAKSYPGFEQLVEHIYSYLRHLRDALSVEKPSKRTKGPSNNTDGSPLWQQLQTVPSDLFGLRRSAAKTSSAKLLYFSTIGKSNEALYSKAQKCFLHIWEATQIYPQLIAIDKHFNGPRKKSEKHKDVIGRCFSRGFALDQLQQHCSEGIFASEAIWLLLASPTLAFTSHSSQDAKFFAAFRKDPDVVIQPISSWLTGHLQSHPQIATVSRKLGEFIHVHLLELELGHLIPIQHYRSPENVPIRERASNPTKAPKKKIIYTPVTVEKLIPGLNPPTVALLALIIREGLNKQRNLPAGVESLRWVLEGKHPTRGHQQYDSDQTDPVRYCNCQMTLLREKIPLKECTQPHGLPNVLVYFGTGQGGPTAAFMGCTNMVSPTLDHCAKKFEDIYAQLTNLIAQSFAAEADSTMAPAGYMQIDNPRVWGQASNHLSLTPTVDDGKGLGGKMTILQKFTPYFSPAVSNKWIEFLGDLAGKDPDTYTGSLNSWLEGLLFLKSLGVSPFNSGLTPMQCANALVFLKILLPPTPSQMAHWVAEHPDLGAASGLAALGFDVSSDSALVLGFGAIFVEHVLCKVTRWIGRLGEDLTSKFIHQAHLEDSKCLPIPLQIALEHVETTLKSLPSFMQV
ncbi:hypothetical protein PILCRDRAFT_12761 [Piloderma croceum F 1598]|uniref:Chromo domain-containing protein n=1 Tax=Piloderma croceum (strain F 1598) TaxID=765440 RepID=A0A0C3ARG1_PILCF|nr:hypothetical protein PILCRDRAFT_12761 [Piloderma croceum F 1598]